MADPDEPPSASVDPAAPVEALRAAPDPEFLRLVSRETEAHERWVSMVETTATLGQPEPYHVVPLTLQERLDADRVVAVSAVVERWWFHKLLVRRELTRRYVVQQVGQVLVDMFGGFWDRQQDVIDTKAEASLARVRARGPLTSLLESDAATNRAPLAGVRAAAEILIGHEVDDLFWNTTVAALGLIPSSPAPRSS